MARQQGRGKVYKYADKCWYIDYTDARGKRRRQKGGTTKREAEVFLAERIAERGQELTGIDIPRLDGDATMGEVMEDFLAAHRRGRTEARMRKMRTVLSRVEAELPVGYLSQLRQRHLENVVADWEHEAGLANSTVNTMLKVVNMLIRWIERSDLRPLKALKEGRAFQVRPPRALTNQELDQLIEAAEAHALRTGRTISSIYAAKLLFMAETGCRHSEAANLQWDDIDLEQRKVTFRAHTVKTRQQRTVPLRRRLLDRLKILDRLGPYVFPKRDGTPLLRSAAFNLWLQRRLVDAGLPYQTRDGVFTGHGLRHTFATRMALAGVPIQKAQYLMGHKSAQMLTGIYTHIRATDVAELLDAPDF